MIAKITQGADVRALAAYLHGPGRANEHIHAHRPGGAVIGGNLGFDGARDGADWAALLGQAAATRPDIARPIWHASLRNPPSDRMIGNGGWALAAQDFAQQMGFADHPWVVVRHGADHIHVVVSRVDFEGRVWARNNDRYRAQRACTDLERVLGLSAAPRRASEASRRVADHRATSAEWRRALRQQRAPARVELAQRVRTAAQASQGRGRDFFEAALERADVDYELKTADTGTASGYSFHLPGHRTAAGEVIWFKASQLDKELAWSRLAPMLQGPLPPQEVVVARRPIEFERNYAKRVDQAEQQSRMASVRVGVEAKVRADDAWWRQRAKDEAAGAAARALERVRAAAPVATTASAAAVVGAPNAVALAAHGHANPFAGMTRADVERAAREAAAESAGSSRSRSAAASHAPRGPSRGR